MLWLWYDVEKYITHILKVLKNGILIWSLIKKALITEQIAMLKTVMESVYRALITEQTAMLKTVMHSFYREDFCSLLVLV